MKQQATGWTLIVVAFIIAAYNMADTISDLHNWHGIYDPGFVGPALKSFLGTVLAALGGKALPTAGE